MTNPDKIPTFTELLQAYRKELADSQGKLCPPSWIRDIINAALAVPPPPADSGQALKYAHAYQTGSTATDASARLLSRLSSSMPSLGWHGHAGESARQALFSLSAQSAKISAGLQQGYVLQTWANNIAESVRSDNQGYSQLTAAVNQLAPLLKSPVKNSFTELAVISIRLAPVVELAISACDARLHAFRSANIATNVAIQGLMHAAALIPIRPSGPIGEDPLSAVRNEYPYDSPIAFPDSQPPVVKDPSSPPPVVKDPAAPPPNSNSGLFQKLEDIQGRILPPVASAKIAN